MPNTYQNIFFISFLSVSITMLSAGVANGQGIGVPAPTPQQERINQQLPDTKSTTVSSPEAPPEIPEEISNMSHYTLGKTDIVEISVMRHPEVSGQFIVNNEGNIQYEFIGDINVEGLTKDDIKKLLTKKLSNYIIDPEITVKIVGYNSKIVYVVGEVGHPGKIYMQGDTITVHEALINAGLPLLSAKTKAGKVITPSESGKPLIRKVNVERLLYHGDLRENLVMKPGDTLYVPPTFLAKTMRAIQPVAAPIGTAATTGRTVTTGF